MMSASLTHATHLAYSSSYTLGIQLVRHTWHTARQTPPPTHHPGRAHQPCPHHSLGIQLVKLHAPHVIQAGCLVGAEQAPLLVALHPPHEEVADPQAVEEVTCTGLLLAVVFAQVKEVLQQQGRGRTACSLPNCHYSMLTACATACSLPNCRYGMRVRARVSACVRACVCVCVCVCGFECALVSVTA